MSEARMATEEDFNRELMRLPAEGGISNHYPHPFNTGGDGGPHMRGFTVPLETIVGQFTRATLADGLRLMSTPKDEPNLIAELWNKSVGEPHRGEIMVLPREYPLTFTVDTAEIERVVKSGLMSYVGQHITEEMVKRVTDDVAEKVREAYAYPNPKTTFETDADRPVVVEEK